MPVSGHLELAAALPAGVVGLAVGSFCGVVADRVPRGESIARPGSHCDACGVTVRGRDNVPLLSYLALRGRCRACGARIPPADLVLEVLTAALFVLLAWRLPTLWALPAYGVFSAGLVALATVDLRLRRLPTPVVYWTGGLGAALLVVASAATGDWDKLISAGIGAAACLAVFFAVYVAVPRGMGFGDVRLATLCGGLLGWLGLRVVPLGILLGFVLAALPALALLAAGRATRKSQLPFGPYLAGGALLGVLFGPAILRATGLF